MIAFPIVKLLSEHKPKNEINFFPSGIEKKWNRLCVLNEPNNITFQMKEIQEMERNRKIYNNNMKKKPVCLVSSLQLCKQYFIISTIYWFTVNGIN